MVLVGAYVKIAKLAKLSDYKAQVFVTGVIHQQRSHLDGKRKAYGKRSGKDSFEIHRTKVADFTLNASQPDDWVCQSRTGSTVEHVDCNVSSFIHFTKEMT